MVLSSAARGFRGSTIPLEELPAPDEVGLDLPGAHRVHLVEPAVGDLPAPLQLTPGRVVGLVGSAGSGMTRLGLAMLAAHPATGPAVYLDARGWLCPAAAWEAGMDPDSLVIVRCDDPVAWGRVAATLVEGVGAICAEVPAGVKDPQLRALAALVRRRAIPMVLRPLRGDLPPGLAHLRLMARSVEWDGADAGHGRLGRRRLVVEASGKAVQGRTLLVELEDHGTDAVHLVPRLAAAPAGRAAG
ncbi:MAG TPA: hypothetical protein VGC11_15945 [Acidimicrobiia bacterium]